MTTRRTDSKKHTHTHLHTVIMDNNERLNMDYMAEQFEKSAREKQNLIYIKAVGVGGGGSNAVNYMYNQGIENVAFAVINTDFQALNSSPVPCKVLIGSGLGAGNKPEVAREAAEQDIAKIEALFEDNTQMVFITATLGGGTGTGAGPVVARVAKEKGLLTIGIVTIPFYFEGDSKILKALDGVDEMRNHVDALLIINNDRLVEIYADLDFFNALAKSDDTLATAARSISEIITSKGHMNLDFRDVETTLRNGGAAIISTGYGEGENRVTKAIENALDSPLLKNRDIFGSKKLLFNLYFSEEATNKFRMGEMQEFTTFVKTIDSKVDVIWGAAVDNTLGEQVKVTLLASGFEEEDSRERFAESAAVEEQPVRRARREARPEPEIDRIRGEYGGKVDTYATNYIILTPAQMDDDKVMEVLENSPAYKREKRVVESVRKAAPASAAPAAHVAASRNPAGGMDISF